MKKFQQILKRRTGMIGMICLLSVLLSSCLKDNNNYVNQPAALVTVINASPDSQPLDFFMNQNRVNNAPIAYSDRLDYFRAYPGNRTANFYIAGSQQKVISDSVTLQVNKYYSIFLANHVSKPDVVFLADSISAPAAGMASIRFGNLSPDAPAVDLGIKGGALLASNVSYKGFSLFVPVQGDNTYTLEIRQAGTSTVLASISNRTLHGGAIYTVWLQGFAAATDQTKLAAQIQTNAFSN
jgi:hypothetical protein